MNIDKGGHVRSINKSTVGMTLIEVILVLMLAASIIVVGLKQYQSYRFDADTQQLQYNMDQLFQAMAGFYSANCGGQMVAGAPTGGLLFINAITNLGTVPAPSYPISIATLINNGFLTAPLNESTLLSTTPGEAFVLQFNLYPQTRYMGNPPTPAGTIFTWTIQVAILLNDLTQLSSFQSILNANCNSTLNGDVVAPCAAHQPGDYLVFERLPSDASPNAQSTFWPSTPAMREFKQMYSAGQAPNQYFNCGS